MIHADKALDELRSMSNEFCEALQQWIASETKTAYDRALELLTQISHDYDHIQEDYEGQKTATIATNIIVTYLSEILKKLPDEAIHGIFTLWHDLLVVVGTGVNLSLVLPTALRTLPPEKYETLQRYEQFLLLPLEKPPKD